MTSGLRTCKNATLHRLGRGKNTHQDREQVVVVVAMINNVGSQHHYSITTASPQAAQERRQTCLRSGTGAMPATAPLAPNILRRITRSSIHTASYYGQTILKAGLECYGRAFSPRIPRMTLPPGPGAMLGAARTD